MVVVVVADIVVVGCWAPPDNNTAGDAAATAGWTASFGLRLEGL